MLTWILHLLTVLFRLYLVKLRAFTIFRFLNYLDINDYKLDLKKAVHKEAARGGNYEDITEDSSRGGSSRKLLETTTPHGLKRQRARRMGGGGRRKA